MKILNKRGLLAASLGLALVSTASAQWSDNFDSYTAGTPIEGQGGWHEWTGANQVYNTVSTAQAVSGMNSVRIVGSADPACAFCSDTVHELNGGVASGQWTFTTMQYVPSSFSGSTYVIMLNQYDTACATCNWSAQIHADAPTAMVVADVAAAAAPVVTGGDQVIAFDSWAEYRICVDLVTDTAEVFYNGTSMVQYTWSLGVSGGGGLPQISTLDLFPADDTVTEVFYDDFSLAAGNTCSATAIGTNYCVTNPNSSGGTGMISATGNSSSANGAYAVDLLATSLATNQFGYFIVGQTQGFAPMPNGSQGNLCLAGSIGRVLASLGTTGAAGELSYSLDVNAVPTSGMPVAIMSGETWYAQLWFRDVNPTTTSNFTDGLQIDFN